MYWEINVSRDGRHFFATARRSVTSQQDLDRVLPELRKRFLPVDGYQITVTRYDTAGTLVFDSHKGT